jgi:hypothetical protein
VNALVAQLVYLVMGLGIGGMLVAVFFRSA